MMLKADCRHFPGDRPCAFHKETGVLCPECPDYSRAGFRILIIKLEAVGDVLRTTSVLPAIREKYPGSHVTWLTMSESADLFHFNPLIDSVIAFDAPDATPRLSVERFHLMINFDAAPKSAAAASFAQADEKLGYGLDAGGKVYCFNAEAEPWFEMGAFDNIKRANKRSFQSLMLGLCRLPSATHEIILSLSPRERDLGEAFLREHNVDRSQLIVGMNTGASPRWEQKKWTMDGYRGLIQRILANSNHTVVLYGGRYERERNRELRTLDSRRVIVAETEQSLRDFFALLNVSDLVITGDTLALHAATALKKRVIAIFGPTSAAEIESYGLVRKVVSESLECRCYYRPVCDQDVNCMNTISPDRMFTILQEECRELARAKGRIVPQL